MTDTITKSVAISSNGQLNRYQVTFSLDMSSVHKPNVILVTVIPAKNLTNPTDLTAVKTAACKMASAAKTKQLASASETTTAVALTGTVSL